MLNKRHFVNLLTLGLWVWPGLMLASPVFAQSVISMRRPSARVIFKPPASNKKPDRTIGAGVRQGTTCRKNTTALPETESSSASQLPLMALVPGDVSGGLTSTERPSFWVYLPSTRAKQVMLSLREEGKIFHSQTFFPIQGNAGLKQLTLPPGEKPLALNKTYQWAVVLVCGDRPGPNDPMITAWVRRIGVPTGSIQRETALNQAVWYAEKGIWYDALSALVQARSKVNNPQDFSGIWSDFLKSVQLEPIPTEWVRSSWLASP